MSAGLIRLLAGGRGLAELQSWELSLRKSVSHKSVLAVIISRQQSRYLHISTDGDTGSGYWQAQASAPPGGNNVHADCWLLTGSVMLHKLCHYILVFTVTVASCVRPIVTLWPSYRSIRAAADCSGQLRAPPPSPAPSHAGHQHTGTPDIFDGICSKLILISILVTSSSKNEISISKWKSNQFLIWTSSPDIATEIHTEIHTEIK